MRFRFLYSHKTLYLGVLIVFTAVFIFIARIVVTNAAPPLILTRLCPKNSQPDCPGKFPGSVCTDKFGNPGFCIAAIDTTVSPDPLRVDGIEFFCRCAPFDPVLEASRASNALRFAQGSALSCLPQFAQNPTDQNACLTVLAIRTAIAQQNITLWGIQKIQNELNPAPPNDQEPQ